MPFIGTHWSYSDYQIHHGRPACASSSNYDRPVSSRRDPFISIIKSRSRGPLGLYTNPPLLYVDWEGLRLGRSSYCASETRGHGQAFLSKAGMVTPVLDTSDSHRPLPPTGGMFPSPMTCCISRR